MECVANYEIKAECSVVADDLVIRIRHPKELYRARIAAWYAQTFPTWKLAALVANPKPDKPDHFGAIDCTHDGKAPPRESDLATPAPPETCLYNGLGAPRWRSLWPANMDR